MCTGLSESSLKCPNTIRVLTIPALMNQNGENLTELSEHVVLPIEAASLPEVVDGLDCREDLKELEQLVEHTFEHFDEVWGQGRGVMVRRIAKCMQLVDFKLHDVILIVLGQPLCHCNLEASLADRWVCCTLCQEFIVFPLQKLGLGLEESEDLGHSRLYRLREILIAVAKEL